MYELHNAIPVVPESQHHDFMKRMRKRVWAGRRGGESQRVERSCCHFSDNTSTREVAAVESEEEVLAVRWRRSRFEGGRIMPDIIIIMAEI